MSFNYEYSREIVDGQWNINNKYQIDGSGDLIRLPAVVKPLIPGNPFKMQCDGPLAVFLFETELTEAQKGDLDTTVQTYKDYTGS